VPWSLRVTSSRSQSQSTVWGSTWIAPAEPASDAVLVGPKLDVPAAMQALGGGLVSLLLKMVLGDRAEELAGAREVTTVGSAAFQERFTVLSTSDGAAAALLTDEVQAALMGAPFEQLVVLRWRDELQVRCARGAWAPDEAVALVRLGEQVALGCGY